jgi:hypothetical protein
MYTCVHTHMYKNFDECSGLFPLTLSSGGDDFIYGLWPRRCPFLRLVCWVVWQCMLPLPLGQLWGGLGSAWLSLGFLTRVHSLAQVGSQKWPREGLVNEQSPAPFTHRASLWVRNELLSWWDCQFQLTPTFSKAVQCLAFTTVLLSHPIPTWAFSAPCSAPPPRQRGNVLSTYLATTFVWGWVGLGVGGHCNWLHSWARVCGSLQNRQCVTFSWWVCRFALLKMGQLQDSAGRPQTEVLRPHVLGGSRSSQMLAALFLWFSALHYCWQDCRHTPMETGLRRQAQSEVLCPCILWWVQVFPDAFRCLSALSALCFSFSNTSGRELREKKRKKAADQQRGCLTLCPAIMHYKKLV